MELGAKWIRKYFTSWMYR